MTEARVTTMLLRVVMPTVVVVSLVSMGAWVARNAHPANWDDAEYLNSCRQDLNALRTGGLGGLVRSLLETEVYRPPAHRLLALTASPWFGAEIGVLRTVSILSLTLGLVVTYWSVRRLAGERAALLAAALFVSPLVVQRSIRWFGSESALYLAVAATFGSLLAGLAAQRRSWWLALALGASLGLGLLAKLTFPLVVALPLALALVLALRQELPGLGLPGLALALAVGGASALPWYVLNLGSAWELGRISQRAARYSLGASWDLGAAWASMVAAEVGPAVAWLVLALTVAIVTRRLRSSSPAWPRLMRVAAWMCMLGALPLPVIQLLGSSNHALRISSPALIPLAAALAVAAEAAGALRRIAVGAIACSLLLAHSWFSVWPDGMLTTDHWNWEPVYEVAQSLRPDARRIGYLGQANQYNRPSIAGPWIRRNQRIEVACLWNADEGDLRWSRVLGALDGLDFVLVLPDLDGLPAFWNRDNAHNAQFDRRLRRDSRFEGPIRVPVGTSRTLHLYVHR